MLLAAYGCGVETDPSLLGFQLTMRHGRAVHSILLQTLGYEGQLCPLHRPSYDRAPIFVTYPFSLSLPCVLSTLLSIVNLYRGPVEYCSNVLHLEIQQRLSLPEEERPV